MLRTSLEIFTDSGGIIALDPVHSSLLEEDSLGDLNVLLDPEGKTDQTSGFTPEEWAIEWNGPSSRLRQQGPEGAFTLLLTGEGAFHVRVQSEPLTCEELARVSETFAERIHISSGQMAVTSGMELFEGQTILNAGQARMVTLTNGSYLLNIHILALPPQVIPTIGIHGDREHPVIIFVLTTIPPAEAPVRQPFFPRVHTFPKGHQYYEPGWNAQAVVTHCTGKKALLYIKMTESTMSGRAEVETPGDIQLKPGDRVLVQLEIDMKSRWRCRWMGRLL